MKDKRKQIIEVIPYDENWKGLFSVEASKLTIIFVTSASATRLGNSFNHNEYS